MNMGNYENLKQSITDVIRTNGNQEITGAVLQSTLLTIISTVGANATFAGIATLTTNPGTPDGSVFYLASESGTYSNFGNIELQDGLSVLMWHGSWSSQQIFGVDDVPTCGSDNLVKSGGVFKLLFNKFIKGADMTYIEVPTYGLLPNHTYYLFIKDTNWSLPSDMPETGINKLAIDSVYNGVKTNIKQFVKSSVVQQPIPFTVPQNSDYILVGGRATAGTNIEFYISDADEQCLEKDVYSYIDMLKFKYIQGSIFNGDLNPNNTKCISTEDYIKIGGKSYITIINEKQQDNNYWKVRVSFYSKNKFLKQFGYEFIEGKNKYSIPDGAEYVKFSISLCDGVTGEDIGCVPSDIPTDGTKIMYTDTTLHLIEEDVITHLFNKSIVGAGMTYVEVPTYGLIPNHTYCLFIKDINWTLPSDMPESGSNKLAIDSVYNGTKTNIIMWGKNSVIPQPVVFTMPANTDYLLVGGRAAEGTNIEFYISDTDEQDIENYNIFDLQFVQGTIYYGSLDPNNTRCISTKDYISLNAFNFFRQLFINNEMQQDGNYWKIRITFYNIDKQYVSMTLYSFYEGREQISIPDTAAYIRLSISLCNSSGEDIGCTPSDIPADGTKITLRGIKSLIYADTRFQQLEQDIKMLQVVDAPSPLNRMLGYDMHLLFSVFSGYGDAACYNNLIFQFINGNQYVYVHDASNGAPIQTITMPNPNSAYHNNSVSFGSEKYDVNDTYPLLYASQENPAQNKCIVYRITGNQGSYEMAVVQTITYPTNAQTGMNYHNCYIDTKNNYLLLGGLVNYPYSDTDGNTLQYIAFELPALSDGDITLQMSDVLFKSGQFANMPTTQGGFCKNGYLYQVFGVSGSKLLMVYDIKNCKYHYVYDLAEVYNNEPEGAFDYNNAIHVVFNGGRVYKFGIVGLI